MSSLSCRANAVAAKRYSFDAQDHVVGVGWSPDSASVAALTGSGTLFILDAPDVNVVHELPKHILSARSRSIGPKAVWRQEARTEKFGSGTHLGAPFS